MGALRYGLFLLLAVVSAIEAGPALKMDRPQVNIRADATVQASRVAVLAQDVEVEALGRKDEWFRISLPDGREGWVHSRLVREIVVVTGEGVRLREAGSTMAPTVATASATRMIQLRTGTASCSPKTASATKAWIVRSSGRTKCCADRYRIA